MAIDLSFNERQRELQTAAHQVFSAQCPTSAIREIEAGGVGYQPDLWGDMAERGWLSVTFPSGYGGGDGDFLDYYPLYEEMGRFLVPGPHLDTVAVAGDVIMQAGSEEQRQRVLPAIASGRCLVSVAHVEPGGSFRPAGIACTATPRGSQFAISGTKLLVGLADSADYFLVTARREASGTGEGVTLLLVDAGSDGISLLPLDNIAGVALFEVGFDDVVVPADAVVGDVDAGWATFSRSATKAAVLQTATIVGGARAVLDMTNQYAKDRQQFGSPIGSYQAVQYMVSDILVDLHRVDLLAKQAAYRIDAERPFAREAAMAIAFGKKAAAHLNRQAHEVHAGVGFMVENDLQLFSRRSKFWENNLGDARYHQEQLAGAINL